MEKLSQKRREVFKISKIDELSNKEIAKKLGISVRSMVFGQLVGVYISQAREQRGGQKRGLGKTTKKKHKLFNMSELSSLCIF